MTLNHDGIVFGEGYEWIHISCRACILRSSMSLLSKSCREHPMPRWEDVGVIGPLMGGSDGRDLRGGMAPLREHLMPKWEDVRGQ